MGLNDKPAKKLQKPAVKGGSFREIGLVIFIVAACAAVNFRNSEFLTWHNLSNLLSNTAVLSILAVGMMMVMLTGGIDLSIGAVMAFAGMVVGLTTENFRGVPPVVLIIEGTAIGTLAGLINGILVARFNILPIIATLGMMNVFRGLTHIISGGQWVGAHEMSDSFKSVATGNLIGIPYLVWIAVVIYLIYAYFINHSRTGRRIYAVGSNPEAAEITGLPRVRITALTYILMGLLAGLGGVLWVSKFASAMGNTAQGYEMNVIAACVLGGVSVTGGRGTVPGLILGVIMFGVLEKALPMINISPFWQQMIQGIVILVAIVVNVMVKRRNDYAALKARAAKLKHGRES